DFAADFIEDQQRLRLDSDLLKKARVFDRDHQAAGEQGYDFLLVFGEIIQVAALNVQDADALSTEEKRNREFGLHAFDRVDIAGILRDIADPNGLASRNRGAGDALADRNTQIFGEARRIPDGEAVSQVGT